jgi:hypothetical protein
MVFSSEKSLPKSYEPHIIKRFENGRVLIQLGGFVRTVTQEQFDKIMEKYR